MLYFICSWFELANAFRQNIVSRLENWQWNIIGSRFQLWLDGFNAQLRLVNWFRVFCYLLVQRAKLEHLLLKCCWNAGNWKARMWDKFCSTLTASPLAWLRLLFTQYIFDFPFVFSMRCPCATSKSMLLWTVFLLISFPIWSWMTFAVKGLFSCSINFSSFPDKGIGLEGFVVSIARSRKIKEKGQKNASSELQILHQLLSIINWLTDQISLQSFSSLTLIKCQIWVRNCQIDKLGVGLGWGRWIFICCLVYDFSQLNPLKVA